MRTQAVPEWDNLRLVLGLHGVVEILLQQCLVPDGLGLTRRVLGLLVQPPHVLAVLLLRLVLDGLVVLQLQAPRPLTEHVAVQGGGIEHVHKLKQAPNLFQGCMHIALVPQHRTQRLWGRYVPVPTLILFDSLPQGVVLVGGVPRLLGAEGKPPGLPGLGDEELHGAPEQAPAGDTRVPLCLIRRCLHKLLQSLQTKIRATKLLDDHSEDQIQDDPRPEEDYKDEKPDGRVCARVHAGDRGGVKHIAGHRVQDEEAGCGYGVEGDAAPSTIDLQFREKLYRHNPHDVAEKHDEKQQVGDAP
mmetsp:Transcript_72725/g.194039  ORF Transcript_72725/g.194039 Transcript_72725/m.194039 type:complete len:301 (-) Transcript_72725:650-1552(-)